METERLMQAVLQSFLDSDLRVEVLPREDKPSTTTNTGTGPSRERYDATTQSADGRYAYKTQRMNQGLAAPEHVNSTAQAVDGRYASVYKVHHCMMTPTSPPLMTSEFPPQRPDVAYGGDNFQVGGTGSGETGSMPTAVKTTCYRGAGLNWPSRGAVCAPRMSRCADSFASSLRKYPSISPEHSSEVIERLVNYTIPRVSRSPRSSPHHSPRRSPPREPISYRSLKAYEETYAANSRPRAPEDCPTRDRRDDFRKHINTKQGDIRLIREVSRRLRKTLKSISSYSATQTLTSGARNQEWCDTPIPETSETDHEYTEEPRTMSHPVNTTVQAVAPTSSLGVETKVPSKRTIAVPVSPSPSSRLSPRACNLPDPVVTRSVQTFEMRCDIFTSTTELTKYNSVKVVVKKSKSLSDFRLNKDFKSEILAWLDDISDPKIKDIQDTVLRNLRHRLKGESMAGVEKIKVKLGNCLKHQISSEQSSRYEFNKKHRFNSNTQSQDEFNAEGCRLETDQNVFEEVIKDWLGDISIKKRDIFLRPVQKSQIYNTFVNRLKHLVFEKSKNCKENLLREEILEILDEVPIEVNTSDKTVYLSTITDALVYRLENILQDRTKPKPFKFNMPDKSNLHLRSNSSPRNEKETKNIVVNAMVEVLKKRNAINPNMIKRTIVELVDILMNSVNTNIVLEEIAGVLHKATKLSEKEAFQFAAQLTKNCKDLNNKRHATMAKSQPLAVFMVQHLSRNYVTKTSGPNMSRHSIGSIVDKDIEANLNQYKTKLAQQIDKWLSDLAVLRANDTDFRQAVVLDLASDIVDRQKYLEFNKDRGTDMDELEHLKYQIFKWMKRYVGEENMEALEHAAELMEMIKNIPVPIISRSQYHLYKSNSGICCKDDRFEPCTSNDITTNYVYGSKSDSGLCNRESHSGLVSTHIRVNVSSNKKDDLQKQKQQSPRTSTWNVILNLSSPSVHDNSEVAKHSLNNLKYCETSKHTSENIGEYNINSNTQNKTNQSIDINREKHSQETLMPTRSRDILYKSHSAVSCRDGHFEQGILFNNSNEDILNSNSNKCNMKESQNGSILTNYMVHKVSTNKTNDLSKEKYKTPSTSGRKNNITNTDYDSLTRIAKYKKKYRQRSRHKLNSESNSDSRIEGRHHSQNAAQNGENIVENTSQAPGPSGLITPVPTYSGKPSSAAAKLMADWRTPPVFTPPPPGLPLISQVHEDFQEYLKNWCQQIPIASNTPEEVKIAEKARLGILNGIWKIITKIKTQPAVFQNKFYYEDVLGKEIDELLDCLPQTQEMQQKRYSLKAQLLEKNSEMNDLIKELEMPENYKELVTDKEKRIEDEKLRKNVKTDLENPTKIFEELLMYCTLDDFLKHSYYQETDKMSAKAYKNKLLRTIQAYMDGLKNRYGKEIEDLPDVYKEAEIYDILYKVPIPTQDSLKENEDEILLGVQIEEWMEDLPLVKNDDLNEQRHRRRLRDALTKKMNEMEKRSNIGCCDDTQVRHEISFFLDRVPLERDQDLKMNEMVDDLTNRLKRIHGAGGRRKSVAFQDGHQNQSANQSNRLLNRSQLANATIGPGRRYSAGNEWPPQDDDAQYRNMFQNAPLCSTRIEQPDDWAMVEDQDAQYRALFKDKPACSSMIEPQGYGPRDSAPAPPDYPPYNQDPYFVYTPDQFHESARGGAFGYSIHDSPQQYQNRYQYPNLVSSRRGSPQARYLESEADLIPNASFPDSLYQPVQGPQSFVSALDADQAPPMMRRSPYNPPSPAAHWENQNEASGSVPMIDHGPPRPQMQMSGHFPNGRPPYNSHRSQMDPNMSQGAAGFHTINSITSARNEQPMMEPVPFLPDASRFSRTPIASRSNRIEIDPSSMRQEPLEVSVHEDERFSRSSRAAMSYRQGPDMLQANAAGGFASMAYHQTPGAPVPLDISAQNQSFRQASQSRAAMSHRQDPDMLQGNTSGGFVSMASHQPGAPLETSAQNQSFRQANPSSRMTPAPQEFRRSTDREGIQEIINQNRSANRSAPDIQVQGPSRGPLSRQASTRDQLPSDRLGEPASGPPSSPQRSERRFLASNALSSEISNQPAFYSTPDQRASQLPPPNMRERRQIEKERMPARRLDMDTEDNEGDERCRCRARFKRWNRQGPNCTTCEECVHGQRGFYPYPYPYPYVPFARLPPPYPPHCRRFGKRLETLASLLTCKKESTSFHKPTRAE